MVQHALLLQPLFLLRAESTGQLEYGTARHVFDGLIGYSTRIWDVPTYIGLSGTNLFDKEYSEGGWNLARGREVSLTGRISF